MAITTAIIAGLPFIALGPIFATNIATTLFGPKFAGSGPALGILSASVAVSLVQIVVTSIVMGTGRERPYVRAMSLGAAANIVLNLILIPLVGITGAAISTVVSECLVLAAGISQMLAVTGSIEVRWRPIGEAAVTAGLAAVVAVLVRHETGFLSGALGAIAVYVVVIAVRTVRDPRWLKKWLEYAA
jgi:O-antigen/teichoic acid export membrane protein